MGKIIHGKLARGGTCTVCALQVQATYAMDGLRLLNLMKVIHSQGNFVVVDGMFEHARSDCWRLCLLL